MNTNCCSHEESCRCKCHDHEPKESSSCLRSIFKFFRCKCHSHEQKESMAHRCSKCGCVCTPAPDNHCRPPKMPGCPPPEICPQPGTVDLPQTTPPPKAKTAPHRPETIKRPPQNDPEEMPWFHGQIRNIIKDGPIFGPRKDEYLPFLFVRANAGDIGNRPLNGVFWESPDIYVVSNLEASSAPIKPPALGGIARANSPNTLYAHVWNVGKAPAFGVRVEFYWFNPSLGISRTDANLIGASWVDLGNRFNKFPDWREVKGPQGSYLSRGCHAIVKCPETWIPSYVNGGHECLVVRVCEPILDAVPPDQFSASADRHVAQRNIAVVPSASPAAIDLSLDLGYWIEPGSAEIDVTVEGPGSMDWLKLYTNNANPQLHVPASPVVTGMLPPHPSASRKQPISDLPFEARKTLLRPREKVNRGCDKLVIPFHASIEDMKHGEAQVLRVRQRMNGDIVGGYTVVLIGS